MSNEKIDPSSIEGERILSEALDDYSPGNTDPIILATQQPQKGVRENIDMRTKQLFNLWSEKYDLAHQELTPEELTEIAREFADLENDFNYIKELNSYVSKRYQQVWDVLPSLQEMDILIEAVKEHSEDTEFFSIGAKSERIKKLSILREARRIDLSGK